jgi:hypothetical protein
MGKPKEDIDVLDIDANVPLSKTQSLSEYFILAMCKHFELTPIQAVALLTDGGKYLTHILVKGLKSFFEPVTRFFQELHDSVPFIISLVDLGRTPMITSSTNPLVEGGDLIRVMNDCKAGLCSKNSETAEIAAKFYVRIGKELIGYNKVKMVWNWFTKEKGGLHQAVLCARRHPEVRSLAIEMILTYGKPNIYDVLTQQLNKTLPDFTDLFRAKVDLLIPLLNAGPKIQEDVL